MRILVARFSVIDENLLDFSKFQRENWNFVLKIKLAITVEVHLSEIRHHNLESSLSMWGTPSKRPLFMLICVYLWVVNGQSYPNRVFLHSANQNQSKHMHNVDLTVLTTISVSYTFKKASFWAFFCVFIGSKWAESPK